jgi:hypothetical protein
VFPVSGGELRIEKPRFDDNASLLKAAKWIILDANDISSRRQVYFYDDIVFKSPSGIRLNI